MGFNDKMKINEHVDMGLVPADEPVKPAPKKQCDATICFGDDFMDNHCTFHCQLDAGHEGAHRESGDQGTPEQEQPYVLEWQKAAKRED